MDGDTKPGAVVVSAKKRFRPFRRMARPNSQRPRRHRMLWLFVILCISLAGGGFFFWSRQQSSSTNNQCNGKNDSLIYKQAANVGAPSSIVALGKVVRSMKDMDNLDTDASCLYIVTNYYLNVGDTVNANKYYQKLVTVYGKQGMYVANMGPQPVKSLEQLKFQLDQLNMFGKQRLEQVRKESEMTK